jgi:hypothetical protein
MSDNKTKERVERTRRDYIDSGRADQDARVDCGEYRQSAWERGAVDDREYEGEWLERQDTRHDR